MSHPTLIFIHLFYAFFSYYNYQTLSLRIHNMMWLPPGVSPKSQDSEFSTISFTFVDIAYMELINRQPSSIRYNWWGVHRKSDPISIEREHKFGIGVSESMFFRYLSDMKILQMDLCDSLGVTIANMFINFSMLKVWRGEREELIVDIKSKKPKIGECKIEMEIKKQANFQAGKTVQFRNISHNSPRQKNTPIHQKAKLSTKPQAKEDKGKIDKQLIIRKKSRENIQFKNKKTVSDDFEQRNFQQELEQKDTWLRQPRPTEKALRQRKKFQVQEGYPCICPQINSQKYVGERLALYEDAALFFNQKAPKESLENINVEFLGWRPLGSRNQQFKMDSCRIHIPQIDSMGNISFNTFTFGRGSGTASLAIDSKCPQQKLDQFIREQQIQIVIDEKYSSHISLLELLSSQGKMIAANLQEIKQKKQILKGHYFLHMIYPQQKQKLKKQEEEAYDGNKEENKNQRGNRQDRDNRQRQAESGEKQKQDEQYFWFYARQLFFLQPHYHTDANIFLKSMVGNVSKTIWKNNNPLFNEIFSFKLEGKRKQDEMKLQIWNRGKKDILLGIAQLGMSSSMQFNIEIPVKDLRHETIGYLQGCCGVGDLNMANKFLSTHLRRSNDQKQNIERRSNEAEQKQIEDEIKSDRRDEDSEKQQPSQRQESEKEGDKSEDNKWKHGENRNKTGFQQPQMTLQEIHNAIFTLYLSQNHSWMHEHQSNNMNMTDFVQQIQAYLPGKNKAMIRIAAMYLNPKTNRINLHELKSSFESFEVYFILLLEERDKILKQFLDCIEQEGSNVYEFQQAAENMMEGVSYHKKEQYTWRAIRNTLKNGILTEKLRFFYSNASLGKICDQLRKFQVFQTSKKQQIPVELLSARIFEEICLILDLDPTEAELRDVFKELRRNKIELSKWEEIMLFGDLSYKPRQQKIPVTGLIKSPTFGVLGTERVNKNRDIRPNDNFSIEDNSSLGLRIDGSQSASQIKFSSPSVSPINQNRQNLGVTLHFSNLEALPISIMVNQEAFDFTQIDIDQPIVLNIVKSFNYSGCVFFGSNSAEFEGVSKEWIGLVDESGCYCGCLIFQ